MASSICEKCGKTVSIGDFPFCPHARVERFGHAPLEGFDEMISADGETFTNWGEKLRYMDRHAIEEHKFRGGKRPGEVQYFDQGKR